jgi:hypothetical protein
MINQHPATIIYISYQILAATPHFKVVIGNAQNSQN